MVKAAKHHLFVQFHGSSKPSGLHRTYPNEFTREGTLNYENFKGCMVTTADHDISMPFYGVGNFPENAYSAKAGAEIRDRRGGAHRVLDICPLAQIYDIHRAARPALSLVYVLSPAARLADLGAHGCAVYRKERRLPPAAARRYAVDNSGAAVFARHDKRSASVRFQVPGGAVLHGVEQRL